MECSLDLGRSRVCIEVALRGKRGLDTCGGLGYFAASCLAAQAARDSHAFGERAILKLMYVSLIRASQCWPRVLISEFELKQIDDIERELDQEFKQYTASTVQSVSRPRIYSGKST